MHWGSPSPGAPRQHRPFLRASETLGPGGTWLRPQLDGARRAPGHGRRLGRRRWLGIRCRGGCPRPPAGQGQGPRPPRPRRRASAADEPGSGCLAAVAAAPRRRLHNKAAAPPRGQAASGRWLGRTQSPPARPGADRHPLGTEPAGRREGAAGRVLGAARPDSALARVEGARPSPTSPGGAHLSPMSSSSAAMAAAAAAQAPRSAS